MKKYFYIIIIVLIIFGIHSIKLNASSDIKLIEEPIVAEINSSSFNDYDLSYMASFSGSVNANKKGMYDLFYLDSNANKYKRNVLILDRDELTKGLAYAYDYDSIDKTQKMGLNGDISINGKMTYKYINEKDNTNKSFAHVYYSDDSESHMTLFENITIKKLVNIDGLAYVLYESKDTFTKIGVMILDKNCIVIRDNLYQTNRSEEGIDLIYLQNKLYIIFNTTSNTGICTRIHSFLSGAIMEINKISLKMEKITFISNNNDSFIHKTYLNDNKIYLECSFTGDNGSYYNTINKSYNGKMILVYDQKSPYVISSIADAYDNYDLVFSNTGYFLCEKIEGKHLIDISYIDYENPNKSYTIPYNLAYETKSITYECINNKLIIIENDDNLVIKVAKIEDKKINSFVYYNSIYKVDKIKYYNDEFYLLSYMDNVLISKLSIYNYQIFQATKNLIKYEDLKIYKNFKEVEISTNYNFDALNYGTYNKKSIKEKGDIKLIYNSKVEVPLKVNIENDQVYDIGSTLTFNGRAYLNNMEIESGYIVENIGKYQLDIYSENNIKQSFFFTIEDKCEKEMVDTLKKNDNSNTVASYMKYEETKQYFANNNYDLKLYENKENVYLILSFILILSFSISIFLIIKGKKGKKN